MQQLREVSAAYDASEETSSSAWKRLTSVLRLHVRHVLNAVTFDYAEDVQMLELGAGIVCTAVRLSEFAFPRHERILWMDAFRKAADDFAEPGLGGKLLGNLGNALAAAGRIDEAETVLRQRLEYATRDQDSAAENLAKEHFGKLLLRQGRFSEAYAILEEVFAAVSAASDQSAVTRLLKDVADAAFGRGEIAKGIQYLKERIERSVATNDSLTLFSTCHVLSERFCSIGDLDQAEHYASKALDLGRNVTFPARRAALLGTLGNIAYERGEFAVAHSHFTKARTIFRELGHIPEMAMTASSLGRTSWKQGNCKRAVRWHQEALDIDRKTGRRNDIAIDLGNLASVLVAMENYDAAICVYKERIQILQEVKENDRVASTMWNLAQTYAANQQHDLAARFGQEAWEYYRSGDPDAARQISDTIAAWTLPPPCE